MLARLLLSALAAFAMVAGVSAQCDTTAVESCTELVFALGNSYASFTLTYDATNQICALSSASGIFGLGADSGVAYDILLQPRGTTGTTGTNLVVPGPSTGPGASATNPLASINLQFTATLSANSANPGNAFPSMATGTLVSTGSTFATSGGTLTFVPFTGSSGLTTVPEANSCSFIRGDPLFSGFRGQQFYVGGEDGQVMNMLSTFNMQLNGRYVSLEQGAAISPAEQQKLMLASRIAHQADPSVAAFPKTLAWSHPGNYFGEVGVALLDDNRVYAKAGPYATGFAKVAMNGRKLPVSDEFIVLGQGVNTTYIQRVSAHELMVRTVNVEYTITNSDNFINIEQVHLEQGFKQHNRFSGLLGKTVDSKWSWNKADEEAAIVKSNDLFAMEQQ